MSDKPLAGGTKWTNEGIGPAKDFWTEVHACQKALSERIRQLPAGQLKDEMQQIINDQSISLTGLLKALHEIELIGIQEKRDRLDDG